jgi:hypothetical protein
MELRDFSGVTMAENLSTTFCSSGSKITLSRHVLKNQEVHGKMESMKASTESSEMNSSNVNYLAVCLKTEYSHATSGMNATT